MIDTESVAVPGDDAVDLPAARGSRFLPQTRTQAVLGVLVLMFLAGTIGLLIGVRMGDVAPSKGSVDAGFLYDMSAHHEQAVLLSEIELVNGDRPIMKAFAREITRAQSYEIGLMAMRLGTWGHDPTDRPAKAMTWMGMASDVDTMPGMATEAQIARFRAAKGAEADAQFVALMTAHHRGGVAMAQYAATHAKTKWVRDTAGAMARIQQQEIGEMARARAAAGLPDRSTGSSGGMAGMEGMTGHTS